LRGDCPQRERSSTPLHSLVLLVTPSCAKLHLHVTLEHAYTLIPQIYFHPHGVTATPYF